MLWWQRPTYHGSFSVTAISLNSAEVQLSFTIFYVHMHYRMKTVTIFIFKTKYKIHIFTTFNRYVKPQYGAFLLLLSWISHVPLCQCIQAFWVLKAPMFGAVVKERSCVGASDPHCPLCWILHNF
jgi:hypothetical protein